MTTRLRLRTYGDPCLRKPARCVGSVGPAEKLLIKELVPAMYAFDGTGLAANQVGIDANIFVADFGEGPFAAVDPEIISASDKQTVLEEGCLSLPGIHIKVKRPDIVRIRYTTIDNTPIEVELEGMPAKIVQHEIDHLSGRMIIDKASRAEKARFKDKLDALEALNTRTRPRA